MNTITITLTDEQVQELKYAIEIATAIRKMSSDSRIGDQGYTDYMAARGDALRQILELMDGEAAS